MSKKSSHFLRADWFAALIVIAATFVLHLGTDVISTLERRFYDFASTNTARQPSGQVAVIAIDDQSIANIGRWPWPRDVHAKLVDQLALAHAKVVVHTAFFFEPQVDRGLEFIQKMQDVLQPAGVAPQPDAAATPEQQRLLDVIAQAKAQLDTDGKLASSFRQAGNVLIPAVYTLGEPQGRPDGPLATYLTKSFLADPNGLALPALRAQWPLELIGSAAAGIGHLNQFQDVDGAVREEPLLVNYHGQAMPSMALLAASKSLNLAVTDIVVDPDNSVRLGKLKISTGPGTLMMPQFYKDQGGRPAFSVDSFYDVLNGKIPASKFAEKIVVIGATAAGVGAQYPVPGNPSLSAAETMAHVISSILSEHFIVQPAWGQWVTPLLILLVCAYLLAALPRLSASLGAAATAILFIALLGSEYGLLSGGALWLKLMLPACLLLIGHLALTTKRFLVTEAGKIKSDEESAETNRMMGLALQGQGQLDMAFDRFRRVPMNSDVMGNLYNLALDFERKRQFNKAEMVYQHMAAFDANYKDIKTKLSRAKNLAETVILGGGAAHPGGTVLLDSGGVEKPMLGRYQVEKELGKGAMGVVYLGKDPKIGRVVAIKTMALSQEFEGSELIDARERFFREAETAGRLQHQNIVTIFDAGEEHDLAYIAMEFLKGRDLTMFCTPAQLLPVPQVLSIVARIARALSYAHQNNVVHRDIKPANIMFDAESDTVKVTDFGIARITDSSKTKTGMVLGTPSFMSPEQLAGKKVDGRSDLYSLGVMLFQLLTGVLPMRGDSMAELMFKITNEPAPDILQLRPDLPPALSAIVQRMLSKQPDARYQDGDEVAAALLAVAQLSQATAGPTRPVARAPAAASADFPATLVQARPLTHGGTPASGTDPGRGPHA